MIKRATKFNWILETSKFLTKEEAKKLLETARNRAEAIFTKRRKTAIRDYLIVDLALLTGLRVMEIAQLDCGDFFIRDGISSLLVRNGKCGKRRLVKFNDSLKEHLEEYLSWKQNIGEPTGPSDPLLPSSNTGRHLTTRAIEKAFKRTASKAGLSAHYAIHCLRHTWTKGNHTCGDAFLSLSSKSLSLTRWASRRSSRERNLVR